MKKPIILMILTIMVICTGCSTMKYEVTSSIEKEEFKIKQYKKWVLYKEDKYRDFIGDILLFIEGNVGIKTDYQASKKHEDFLIVNLKVKNGLMIPPRFDPVGHRYIIPNLIFYAPKSTEINFVDGKSKQSLFKFNCVRGIFKGVYDIYDEENEKYYRTYNEFVMNKFYEALIRYNIIPANTPCP